MKRTDLKNLLKKTSQIGYLNAICPKLIVEIWLILKKSLKLKSKIKLLNSTTLQNHTKESSVEELVRKGDVFEFAMSWFNKRRHFMVSTNLKAEPKQLANKVIKERDIKLKETYKKGQDKLKQMEASIDEIKGQIEGKMSEATSNPDMRETLTSESNSLMEKLSMLEAQIEKLKGVLEQEGMRFEKKSSKKDKKEDEKEVEKDEKK
jgi:hypothetical protein